MTSDHEPSGTGDPTPAAQDFLSRSTAGATVSGERRESFVARLMSLQSRVNNLLALAVMVMVGCGFLVWFYSTINQRQNDAVAKATQEKKMMAGGDMKLPPITIESPHAAVTDPQPVAPTWVADLIGPAPELGTLGQPSNPGLPVAVPVGTQSPQPKSPAELELERRLAPSVLLRPNTGGQSGGAVMPISAPPGMPPTNPIAGGGLNESNATATATYLTPTVTPATSAQILATTRFIIPKGDFLDCTLETALDSQLPGLPTCVIAHDVFSADREIVLVERGSKLVGESRTDVRQGLNRIFVLWTQARTPTGVVVQLASPSADSLGRSGIEGNVDTHFWERFGAAILISVIEGAVQSGVQAARGGGSGGGFIYNPTGSTQVMTEILRNTLAIPRTIKVPQGSRIQVIVARDVDFRPVYELKLAHNR